MREGEAAQARAGDAQESRGLGDVYKRQGLFAGRQLVLGNQVKKQHADGQDAQAPA